MVRRARASTGDAEKALNKARLIGPRRHRDSKTWLDRKWKIISLDSLGSRSRTGAASRTFDE